MTHIKKAAGRTAAVDNARLNYPITLFFSVKAASFRCGVMAAIIPWGLA